MSVIFAADLFCGAGGTSSGLMKVAREMGLSVNLTAINHWPRAVETHAKNHGGARHLCAALGSIEPKLAVPGGKLRLLLASPECTHHSCARGGKPMNDQSRASAWHVLHWIEELRVQDVLIENVKEFEDWGPLGSNALPLKSRKGELFQAFIRALRVTYKHVEWRRLNAKDYGDATSRIRLFIRASHKPIVWPVATHAEKPRSAREIIDWSLPGTSIFTRKRALFPNTLARIEAGFRMQGPAAEPFLVILRNNQDAQTLDKPLPTMTTSGANFGVVEPFILPQNTGGKPREVSKPVPTITTTSRGVGVVEPFMVSCNHGGGLERRVHGVDEPIPTMQCRGQFGLIQPFLAVLRWPYRDADGRYIKPMDAPLPALTGGNNMALVEPFLTLMANSSSRNRVRDLSEPMPTITSADEFGVAEPFLVNYYGQGVPLRVDDPLPTATARDRFGLIEPVLVRVTDPNAVAPFLILINGDWYWIDIRFRMLQPHELAGAMGFDKDYEFTGTREERVKQIGNAVAVNMAAALCRSVLMSA